MKTTQPSPTRAVIYEFHPLARGFGSLLFLCALQGCTQTVRELGAAGAGGAVPAVITELQHAPNQQNLAEVTASPPIQHASWALGVGLGRGMVDETVATITGQPLEAGSTTRPAVSLSSADTQGISAYVKRNVEPAVTEIVRSSVRDAMREILSPESRAKASIMAESLGEGTASGMTKAFERDTAPMLARLFQEQLQPAIENARMQFRPALRDWLQQDVAPLTLQVASEAAATALKIPTRPDVVPAVVENARNLAIGGTYGSHDAAIELGFLSKTGGLTKGAKLFIWSVAVIGILIGLGAIAFLVVLTMIAFALRRLGAKQNASF